MSSDNVAINKSHVRSYEGLLYTLISEHPKMHLTNAEVPTAFALAEYDKSLVDRCLPVIIQLLIAAGFPLANLSLLQPIQRCEDDQNLSATEDGSGLYIFKPGPKSRYADLYGLARREGQTYILQPGSEVRTTPNASYYNEGVERQRVMREGKLQPSKRSDRMLLTRPVRCSNWQTAASALAGANIANPAYWVPVSNLNVQGLPAEMEVAS